MEIRDKKRLVKLMSFLTMGDGSVYRNRGGSNCIFSFSQTEDHKDFIDYVAGVVSNITSCKVLEEKRESPRKDILKVYTPVHPFFNKLRDRIYVDTYKSLDQHALKMLDFEALAILYMCDGCLGKSLNNNGAISYTLTLNLCRLSYGDQLLLKKALKDKLDLEWNVVKTGVKYFTLRLRMKDFDKFMKGIQPYILPSFSYKLEIRTNGSSTEDGDIV